MLRCNSSAKLSLSRVWATWEMEDEEQGQHMREPAILRFWKDMHVWMHVKTGIQAEFHPNFRNSNIKISFRKYCPKQAEG